MTTMTTQDSGARSVASVKMGNPSLVFGRCPKSRSSPPVLDYEGPVPQFKHRVESDRLGNWLDMQLRSNPVMHHRPGLVLVVFVELDLDCVLDQSRLEVPDHRLEDSCKS